MGSVSRYEIGSDLVDPFLHIYQMYKERKEFSELDILEKIKRICGLLTSVASAANGALALHDDHLYRQIDAGLGAASIVEVGIEGYQTLVPAETCDTGTVCFVAAKVVRIACSVLTILPLPSLAHNVFSMTKNAATLTVQLHQIFWKPFFTDPRTNAELPFSEKDEKQFCQWVACLKGGEAFLCTITKRFVRRPAVYPEREVTVDFESIDELKQRNVTEIRIKSRMYIVAQFGEASTIEKDIAEVRYREYRVLYGQSILFQNGLKKCLDENNFAKVPTSLLQGYRKELVPCSITGNVIRFLSFPESARNVFYEKTVILTILKKNLNKLPPLWPASIPFARANITVSGAVCEKYESIVKELFLEIHSSLVVIDQSCPSLREKFHYFIKNRFLKGGLNKK